MKFFLKLFFFTQIIFFNTFSQVQTVSAQHPVYQFLHRMQVKGIISDYNPTVLPLSKSAVIDYLNNIIDQTHNISSLEFNKASNYLRKFNKTSLDEKYEDLFLFNNPYKNLYNFSDSSINFIINPVLGVENIRLFNDKKASSIFNIGGNASGSYKGWFGFYLQGTNGFQKGERTAARFNQNISQSFTFNQTNLDYFDNTTGYARFQTPNLSFQLGRERVLWGTGNINRLLLSENPPIFDFIRFNFNYKRFTYEFIHGWLVRAPQLIIIDSLSNAKIKGPKYIAINRMGYKIFDNLELGISQAIIYSDRPFEAAYLNPFLFWESAQRSLNDLDNSFLIFDGRYRLINAFEFNSSLLIDDIDFKKLNNLDHIQNNFVFQAGVTVTDPLLFNHLTFKAEYLWIRPYVFSHRGFIESLSYSNNGYLLSPPIQPNSINISLGLAYDICFNLNVEVGFSNTRHGANIYDDEGNLVINFGGNMLEPFKFYQPIFVKMLDGDRETTNELRTGLNYEFAFGLYFKLFHILRVFDSRLSSSQEHIIYGSIQIDLE